MNEKRIAMVIWALGVLDERRRHRDENQDRVIVPVGPDYLLIWHTGNILDIVRTEPAFGRNTVIGRLSLDSFEFDYRAEAVAITGMMMGFEQIDY